jgi:PPK2 family polyphosphate:nucleotide phosphotransferase
MDPQLLSLLRCPRTGGKLRLASPAELICINAETQARQGQDHQHQAGSGKLEQSLICDSAKLCYPVRDGLPVLLPNEAFDLPKSLNTSMVKLEKSSRGMIILDELDQNRSIDQEEYKEKVKDYQFELLTLQRALIETKHSVIVVIEGPDAAGKGGAIKRLVEKLDPRTYRVYSIVKPTQEETRHHYLWRFWNKLPSYGEIAIFDRSWYGRVLVERVEGFATGAEWKRAYREINEFERLLVDDGTLIVKLYLHISKEEQLERFKRREADPMKHWKITEEDWRNRRRWDEHNEAAQDMFEQTSTPFAPWTVVEANFKWYARLKVLKAAIRAMESLDLR